MYKSLQTCLGQSSDALETSLLQEQEILLEESGAVQAGLLLAKAPACTPFGVRAFSVHVTD